MFRGVVSLLTLLVAAMSASVVSASCAGSDGRDPVLVMAAASLTDAFAELDTAFEAANPTIDVRLNLAGSATLREQILQGAPADVFASANTATMDAVITADPATASRAFASNELVVAVPVDNPAGVDHIDDLANDELFVGLCAAGVPCGDFARDALGLAGVQAAVDTNERDARALLTKIAAGELDAGIVYATDAVASADVSAVALPAEVQPTIVYPIAPLAEAPNAGGAAAFVDFVLSSAGQAILRTHGFGTP